MNDRDNLISIMKGRSAIYSYFSMVLAGPPEKGFLGLSRQFLPALEKLGEGTETGIEFLKKYADNESNMETEELLNTLATNYTTFFYVGLGTVPSSESVYLSSARLVKQEPWEKVLAFYHIRKFKAPEHIREPEDHVSVELHFMRFMCELSLYMLENSLDENLPPAIEEQRRFLDEHILKWIPNFCLSMLKMSEYDEFGLYSAVAHLLPVFLESDRELLVELSK